MVVVDVNVVRGGADQMCVLDQAIRRKFLGGVLAGQLHDHLHPLALAHIQKMERVVENEIPRIRRQPGVRRWPKSEKIEAQFRHVTDIALHFGPLILRPQQINRPEKKLVEK
jgi:hypothetical protein